MSQPEKSRSIDAQPPSSFLDYRLYLGSVFAGRVRHHERYTYRDFAADLGFGATTLMHQIVKGYRPLTPKTGERVLAALALAGVEANYFRTLILYGNAKSPAIRQKQFDALMQLKRQVLTSELDQAFLEYFSDWYHPVIREMVAMPAFVPEPRWISAQLRPSVPPEKVKKSLALLERLGLIVYDAERHTYAQTQAQISTGDRVRGMGLVNYHQQMIDLGRDAIVAVPAKRRNIGAVTVCCDEATAARLKELINQMQALLLAEADKPNQRDQIYQINVQMFPFTEAVSTPLKKRKRADER